MERLDMEKQEKRYCIRTKHVVVICVVVVVCCLVVGLSVGLTRCNNSPGPKPTQPPPATTTTRPTQSPTTTQPPEPSGPCQPSTDSSGDWKNFRLPNYLIPVHHELHIEPNMDDDTYTGTVDIHLQVKQVTRHLWLHIRQTFVSATPRLKRQSSNGVQTDVGVRGCFEYKENEYVVVEATEDLSITGDGELYVLSLDFQGLLSGSLVGFYAVTYTENGELKKIAATDHQPTDARKSFPCFDEPNKKATWTVSITHDKAYGALSNMPQDGDPVDQPNNKQRTTFEKSVPMSSYLVCFAVHQFGFLERFSAHGVPLRIYAPPAQLHTAEYAASTTKIIFDYFEEYFNMSYSLSKLDQIAIPNFGTGAMENWGLVTYRETNLLYDENESSSANKQRVASVISHELVHQWFGNIVTMDWWDDLWLNEGFASFFEYVGVEIAEPDWSMRDIVIISDVLPVMVDDALLTSHPIIVEVSTPAEITSVFDSISYSKGASILRMLEGWMGRDLFRDGCRQFLKDHHFSNAKTADFWASQEKVSGMPIAEVMDTWTKQMGYPVLHLNVSGTTASVTQQRFLLDPSGGPTTTSPFGYKWMVPMAWYSVTSNKTELQVINMSDTVQVISDYTPAVDGLLKVNDDHIGFYRVNHDNSMWDTISTQLKNNHLVFDAADRTSYVDDAFALARAGIIDYGIAFSLTMYLKEEKDYIVWSRVQSSLSYVRLMLASNPEIYPKFQQLFREHVQPIATELGWDDTGSQTERLLRETVLNFACQMGDPNALANASQLFTQWIGGTGRIGVNLRLLVYRYGMKMSGSEAHWNVMLDRYKTETLAQEKDKLLYGLASVENVDLLYRLLEATKNESVVKTQDVLTVIRYVALNPVGQSMAWDWSTLNWDYLVGRFTIDDRYFGRLLYQISTEYNTDLQLWKLEHFFSLTPDAGAGETPRKQALETVKNNIEWVRANEEEIRVWLQNNVV